MVDVKIIGKDAHLIHDEKIELYYKSWIRDIARTLMLEAYEAGRQGKFPYDKELQRSGGNGWKELYEHCDERVETMLDIGVLHVKETIK